MKILITVGIILLSFLVIIAFLLLVRVKMFVRNGEDGKPVFSLKFFGFKVFDSVASKNKSTKKISKENTKEINENPKEKLNSKSIKNFISNAYSIFTELKKIIKKSRLEKLCINVVVSGADAASVAIEYGVLCAVIYPFVSFVESSVSSKKRASDVSVNCDFDSIMCRFDFEISVSLRLFYAVKAILTLYKKGLFKDN